MKISSLILFALFAWLSARASTRNTQANSAHGTVVTGQIRSAALADNLVGLSPDRTVKVYLPPDYATSGRAYPVVLYLHNDTAERFLTDSHLPELLDRARDDGVVRDCIVVVADFSAPHTGSLFENSPVSGRWLDFITDELVPWIDQHFRTLPRRDSRAVVGDFFGGRGALKLGMTHSDLFGVVYALHPVATGNGPIPWPELGIDWPRILEARTLADLGEDGRTRLFVTICQAFLPHPGKPPFNCDFFMEMKDGAPRLVVENELKIKASFLLEETLTECAPGLRTLRGLAFDWARFDQTQDHVYANRQFSRKLEDLGVAHEAEEYAGNPWNRNWGPQGRFMTRVLPFLDHHLDFGSPP
jgi:Putative esterase